MRLLIRSSEIQLPMLVTTPVRVSSAETKSHFGSLKSAGRFNSTKKRARMRLQVNCCFDTAMGVAAQMESRNTRGRGAFLQSRTMQSEKPRKGR